METSQKAPVIVGVDGSDRSLTAVRWAAREAARRGARLELIHALAIPSRYVGAIPPSDKERRALRSEGGQFLTDAEAAAREVAGETIEIHRVIDNENPPVTMVRASRKAQLVVLGGARHGALSDLLPGATITYTAAHADAPVVITRGATDRAGESAPVVLGVDGNHTSATAIETAFQEAALGGVPLIAVHAWYDSEAARMLTPERFGDIAYSAQESAERALAEQLTSCRESYPDVQVKEIVTRGKGRNALVDLSEQAQLVVVGTRGRGTLAAHVLGSTSLALIHHAACPVMVVRP